ncbi:MAG: Hpt domain-containing protein [Cyclobacteriaceae bacterium]
MRVDLDYLYNICDNDREFIKDMLLTFNKITPESVDGINDSLESKNWKELGQLAHKIKPSVLLLGIEEFSSLIKEIEHMAKNEEELDQMPTKVSLLNNYTSEVIADIQDLIKHNQY